MQWPFPPATYIDHDKAFRRLVSNLASEPLIAIDTESNSMYAYRERLCLLQISTRQADYIVDPLRIADLSPLGPLLINPAIEKVFHSAENDLISLKREYGFEVNNLFDTMLAARIYGHKQLGLNRLLATYLNIEMDKSHQRDDWGQRPLTEEGLLYAQMDTHYLATLRDHLWTDLERCGRQEEAKELFEDYARITSLPPTGFDPDGYWRLTRPGDLNRRQMAILCEVYRARDEIAQERDVPTYKIIKDDLLVAIAKASPTRQEELKRVKGVPLSFAQRYWREILNAVDHGKRAPLPKPPTNYERVDQETADRYLALKDWRRSRAEQRGVEADVILTKESMWGLANKIPTQLEDLQNIPGLGPWRIGTYGADILAVLKQVTDRELP